MSSRVRGRTFPSLATSVTTAPLVIHSTLAARLPSAELPFLVRPCQELMLFFVLLLNVCCILISVTCGYIGLHTYTYFFYSMFSFMLSSCVKFRCSTSRVSVCHASLTTSLDRYSHTRTVEREKVVHFCSPLCSVQTSSLYD